jgi:hypothetical protein
MRSVIGSPFRLYRALCPVQAEDEVIELLSRGVATIVATRDGDLRPEIARGWGIRLAPGRAEATLCVSAPAGSRTRANLEGNGVIAVTCSLPTTYQTIQLKGRALEVRAPTAEQLALVEEHVAAFGREAAQVGLPDGVARRLLDADLAAVTIAVHELYDQTPGPDAGAAL